MIAFVRGVIAASTASGSTLNVTGSMSTNTGFAPSRQIELAVAKNVNGLVMTSSPGPTPSAIRARISASVPDAQPIAERESQYFAISVSSSVTSSPRMNFCSASTRPTAAVTS
ncbi:MAG: hypothetical protein FD138_3921 [Planctomycetota bacterium]|nr:MAG: hypothetical protein FD138_3921 [Planctomycetota bacterium]